MEETIGQALTGFDKGFAAFRDELPAGSGLADMVFSNTSAWANLLVYKLVPHLAGEGCLVAAVAGGTNTGKSTVFNILLGQTVSPVVTTAAATRRPVLAANARRAAQCLEAKLVPEFLPRPIEAQAVVSDTTPVNTLFVAQIDALPDRLVLLDTPDVDSIDKENWEVAENTRAAGDALIAVLTAEKYKDERVVEFFRRAKDAGRIILPLMNKADPADAFLTARKQLDEFCADVGLDDVPRFVIPHDFAVTKGQQRPISSTDGSTDLKTYLESLDVPAIKQRVYRDTVAHFAREAGTFLDRCDELASSLRTVVNEFEARAAAFADKYDPAPGAEIGGLFHEFVQAKRGPVRRMIGSAGATVARGAGALARTAVKAVRKRTKLESAKRKQLDDEVRATHARAIEHITYDLATGYVESSRNLREPAAALVLAGVDRLDLDAVIPAVTRQTLGSESISQEFRLHAHRTIETWWNDHAGRRAALEALDALIAFTPAAIALPISMYTAGFGVSEAVTVAGPFVEQFVARVIEYQFGDQMFDLLSPWKTEQQANLERALLDHLAGPCLADLDAALRPFEGTAMAEMRACHDLLAGVS